MRTNRFNIRLLTALAMVAATGSAMAQTESRQPAGQKNNEKFNEYKEKRIERINEHVVVAQTLSSCLKATTNRDAAMTCNDTARASHPRDQGKHHQK